jgi:3-oxoacyl-[acyl-carrier protein] reductase
MGDALFPDAGAAIVIGGSGGVGAEICRVLARDGCDVALTYFGKEARAKLAMAQVADEDRRATNHRFNVEETDRMRAFVAEAAAAHGGVHTRVYAAGALVSLVHLSKIEPELMKKHLMQDTFGFFNVVQQALPHLRRARGSFVACQAAALFRYAAADGLSVVPKAGVHPRAPVSLGKSSASTRDKRRRARRSLSPPGRCCAAFPLTGWAEAGRSRSRA